jgi:general secretion pathway protein H
MNQSRRIRGFTLVEILVVVIIIGTIMSIAMLSLNLVDDERALQREARKLISLVEIARDEAVFQGREFGVEFMTGSYRFVEYDPLAGQWADVPFDEMLRLRELPEELELELFIDDKRVLLDPNPKLLMDPDDDSPVNTLNNYSPHIYIYSSGDMTPFELTINRDVDDATIALEGDLLGNVSLDTDEDISG